MNRYLPMPPHLGPPLPQGGLRFWPWVRNPQEDEKESPMPEEAEYVMYVRKKGPKPVWLADYQERLKVASRRASEETLHLNGPTRVSEMNRRVSQYMRESKVNAG